MCVTERRCLVNQTSSTIDGHKISRLQDDVHSRNQLMYVRDDGLLSALTNINVCVL